MEDGRGHRVLGSPLHQFVQDGWPDWEQPITSMQVDEGEFLLYLVWMLDAIKEQSDGINCRLWKMLHSKIRQRALKLHFNYQQPDLDYVTNLTCACCLYCYGLTLTGSDVNGRIFSEIVNGMGERWPAVREIKREVERIPVSRGLKEWMTDYVNWEGYGTLGDEMDWKADEMMSLPGLLRDNQGVTNIHIEKFVNQSGAVFNDISTTQILTEDGENRKLLQ